jgi:hypothetical protein
MQTDTELAKLAATLSEAQRRMLFDLPLRALTCDWRVMPSLKKKGLAAVDTTAPIAFRRLEATPLGLALRNHLTKETPRAE